MHADRMLGTAAARRPGATGTRRTPRMKPAQAGRYRQRQRAAERRQWRREWS